MIIILNLNICIGLATPLGRARGHPKASHFPEWIVLNVKWVVLKLKMGSSKCEDMH
jgi:hypothetical protein